MSYLYCFVNNITEEPEIPIYVGKIRTIFENFGMEIIDRDESDYYSDWFDVYKDGHENSIISGEHFIEEMSWDKFKKELQMQALRKFGKLYEMKEV